MDDYLILKFLLTSLGLAVAAAKKKRTYTMFCILLLLLLLLLLLCQVCRGAEGLSVTRTVTCACFIRGPLITASAGLGFDSVLEFGARLSFQPRMVSPRLDAGFLGN